MASQPQFGTFTPYYCDPTPAIRMLKRLTHDRCDLWMLAGSSNAKLRAQLMEVLTGSKVPQAKAGINALETAFYTVCGIIGECKAERDENFRKFCLEVAR